MKNHIHVPIVALLSLFLMPKFAEAQWVQTNGPSGGEMTCLAENSSKLFAGTWSNGLYQSLDRGTSWQQTHLGSQYKYISAVAASKDIVYVIASIDLDYSIFRSTDDGENWTVVLVNNNSSIPLNSVLEISGSNVFSGETGSIIISRDSGVTWSDLQCRLNSKQASTIKAVGTKLYATDPDSGVYVSTDNGESWISKGTQLQKNIRLLMADHNTLAAVDDTFLFLSWDGGITWDTAKNVPFFPSIISLVQIDSLLVAADLRFATGYGPKFIYCSGDSGKSWEIRMKGLLFRDLRALLVDEEKIFVGTRAGIYVSTNYGEEWGYSNKGMPRTYATSLLAHGGYLFAGSDTYGYGILRSSDNGTVWQRVNSDYPAERVWGFEIVGDNIFVAGDSGIYLSTNNGENWKPNGEDILQRVGLISSNGDAIFAMSDSGIFFSADTGHHWKKTSDYHDSSWHYLIGGVHCMIAKGTHLFFGTETQENGGTVYRSDDSGKSVIEVGDTNWFNNSNGISKFFVKGDTLFLGCISSWWGPSIGLYFTTDNGTTWIECNDGLPKFANIGAITSFGNTLFVSVFHEGVFLSYNNGKTWNLTSEGLPSIKIMDAFAINGDTLFAANSTTQNLYNGVWKRSLTEIIKASVSPTEPPTSFTLNQNHPNPFTTSTTTSFTLPERSFVALDIYDVLGNKLRTLLRQTLDAGEHSAEFDAMDLAAGVYVAKLHVNGVEREMKMVRVGE